MKTKNFILPAIALAIFAAPVLAQDYHDQEFQTMQDSVRTSLSQDLRQLASKQEYLNIALLRAQINEDLPVDLKHLKEITKNTIKENKISALEQYSLMDFCIKTNNNDILRTLIEAGFNPEVDIEASNLGFPLLPTVAVECDNEKALELTLDYNNAERVEQVIKELEKKDPSLVNKFSKFAENGMMLMKTKTLPTPNTKISVNIELAPIPNASKRETKSQSTIVNAPGHGSDVNKNASARKPGHIMGTSVGLVTPMVTTYPNMNDIILSPIPTKDNIKVVSDTVPNK